MIRLHSKWREENINKTIVPKRVSDEQLIVLWNMGLKLACSRRKKRHDLGDNIIRLVEELQEWRKRFPSE